MTNLANIEREYRTLLKVVLYSLDSRFIFEYRTDYIQPWCRFKIFILAVHFRVILVNFWVNLNHLGHFWEKKVLTKIFIFWSFLIILCHFWWFFGECSLFEYFSGNFEEKKFSPKFSFWGVIYENLGVLVIFWWFFILALHLTILGSFWWIFGWIWTI